jgi:uncharacterized integral membrane protein
VSFQDIIKKSVWESFTANNGLTWDFVITACIALLASIVFGLLIYCVYKRNYAGVVYSKSFAATLVGMTILTCAITLAISSNIVISLGMVGALSIVRYRTAVKDPVDLLYLFWAISTGIIVAANLYVLAIITMIIMTVFVRILYARKQSGSVYILVIHYEGEEAGQEVLKTLGKLRFQVKSKTIREAQTELTVELLSRQPNPGIADRLNGVSGVKDVSLIQYNGEYNG